VNNNLNSFQVALLNELRQEVSDHPRDHRSDPDRLVISGTSRPSWARRGRVAAGLVATAATASVAILAGTGGGGVATAAAFTITEPAGASTTAAGNRDIVVTIHELADADGLEAALAKHGIRATVNYLDSSLPGTNAPAADTLDYGGWIPEADAEAAKAANPADPLGCGTYDKYFEVKSTKTEEGTSLEFSPATPDKSNAELSTDDDQGAPATLEQIADGWELAIPADSVLHDKKVYISTDVDGRLWLYYPGTWPGAHCTVHTAG
jgi:hypothetical protein